MTADTNTSATAICPVCLKTGMILEILSDEDGWHEVYRHGCDFRLSIFCSRMFAYACADSEEVPDAELEHAHRLYRQHGNDGLILWVAIHRNELPVVEVREDFAKKGIEFPDGLRENECNKSVPRW